MPTVNELLAGSRGIQFTQSGRKSTRRWIVSQSVPGESISGPLAFAAVGVFQYISVHPEWPDMVAQEGRVERVPEGKNQWYVEWDYSTVVTEEEEVPPEEPGFEAVGGGFRLEFVDVWRSPSTISISNPNNPGNVDIGGVPVDSGGNPVSVLTYVGEIRVRQTVTISGPNAYSMGNALSLAGNRNANPAFGLPAGTVLYGGLSNFNRIGPSTYSITHTFAYDRNYHTRQQACIHPQDQKPWPGS